MFMTGFSKYILLLAVSSSIFADRMYFDIDSMYLTKKDVDSILEGETKARQINVSMSGNDVDIETNDGEMFCAKTQLEKDRLVFIKDGIKFSTPLESGNPVLKIEHLDVKEATAELDDKGISVQGKSLETVLDNLSLYIDNVNMYCATEEFTTAIESACVKQVLIKPHLSEVPSKIHARDLTSENKFELNIESREVNISGNKMLIDSENIQGRLDDTKFKLGRGLLKCFKDPRLENIDIEALVNGCLKESNINVENFYYKRPAIDLKINNVLIEFFNSHLSIKSDYASFNTGGAPTFVSSMSLYCEKDIITPVFAMSQNNFVNGCLKKTKFKIGRIENNSFVEEDANIRDLELEVNQGKFLLTARPKILFRVPVKIEGTINFNALTNEIEIRVKDADVAGIPSKNYLFKIMKNFIDGERIKQKGDLIIIQV